MTQISLKIHTRKYYTTAIQTS